MKRLSLLLLSLLTVAVSSCSKEKPLPPAHPQALHPSADLDTSFLDADEPGTIETKNTLPASSNVHVLKESQNLEFLGNDGRAKITGDLKGFRLNPNDIVVGNAKDRYLLRVESVESQNDGEIVFQSRLARLTELNSGSEQQVGLKVTPDWSEKELKEDLEPQNTLEAKLEVTPDGTILIENYTLFKAALNPDHKTSLKEGSGRVHGSAGAGGVVTARIREGQVKFVPTFRADYRTANLKPTYLENTVDSLFLFSLHLEFEFSSAGLISLTKDLFKLRKIPVVLPGAVPIYMDIEMGVPVGISVKAESSGKISVIYKAEYAFHGKIKYDQAHGITSDKREDYQVITKRVSFDDLGQGTRASAEIFLEPRVKTRIYRVLGPYAYLHPYVRGQVILPLRENDDELFVGVRGGVGMQFSEPMFLTTLFDIRRDGLFDLNRSWDLIGPRATQPVVERGDAKVLPPETLQVNQLGDHGYVVIQVKNRQQLSGMQFRITESPKYGTLHASEDFDITGDLYYYPMTKDFSEAKDTIAYEFVSSSGQIYSQKIEILLGSDVISENKRKMFSLTTPNPAVAFAEPKNFRSQAVVYTSNPTGLILSDEVVKEWKLAFRKALPKQTIVDFAQIYASWVARAILQTELLYLAESENRDEEKYKIAEALFSDVKRQEDKIDAQIIADDGIFEGTRDKKRFQVQIPLIFKMGMKELPLHQCFEVWVGKKMPEVSVERYAGGFNLMIEGTLEKSLTVPVRLAFERHSKKKDPYIVAVDFELTVNESGEVDAVMKRKEMESVAPDIVPNRDYDIIPGT